MKIAAFRVVRIFRLSASLEAVQMDRAWGRNDGFLAVIEMAA